MNTITYTVRESNDGAFLLTMPNEGQPVMILTRDAASMAEYLLQLRDGFEPDDLLDTAPDSELLSHKEMADMKADEFGKVIADSSGFFDCGPAGEDMLNRVSLTENPLTALEECFTADDVVAMVENYADIVGDFSSVRYTEQQKSLRRRVAAICRLIWSKSDDSTFSGLLNMVAAWERVCWALLDEASLSLTPYRETEGDEREECSFEDADIVELSGWNVFDPLAEELRDLLNGTVISFTACEWCDDSVTYTFVKA